MPNLEIKRFNLANDMLSRIDPVVDSEKLQCNTALLNLLDCHLNLTNGLLTH